MVKITMTDRQYLAIVAATALYGAHTEDGNDTLFPPDHLRALGEVIRK